MRSPNSASIDAIAEQHGPTCGRRAHTPTPILSIMQQRNAGDPVTEDEPAREQEPSSAESAQVGSAQRTTVMLLGSAESRHELEIAFERLGAEVIAVERDADARAHGVADKSAVVETADTDELAAVGGRPQPNFVVMVGGVVAADALAATAETGFSQVFPAAPGAALTADREALRRLATDELGLPTAPSWFAGSVE
jgi:phosphoribosylglycinamide formyltransferase 2